jgi:hypothetical protein
MLGFMPTLPLVWVAAMVYVVVRARLKQPLYATPSTLACSDWNLSPPVFAGDPSLHAVRTDSVDAVRPC